MVAQSNRARIISQNPLGIENLDATKALKFTNQAGVVLTWFIQVVRNKVLLHTNTPVSFCPVGPLWGHTWHVRLPRLSFSLTGLPRRARVVVSSHYAHFPARDLDFSDESLAPPKAGLSRFYAHFGLHNTIVCPISRIHFRLFRFCICFASGGQFLKREHWCRYHVAQCIEEQIGALAAIESEAHLFQVGGEMLGAQTVPRSRDTAFEERESGFDGIGVNVAHDVYAAAVVNSLVVFPASLSHCCDVRHVVIGENHVHILGDVLLDVPSQRARLRVLGVEEAEIAVALADTENHFFVVHACHAALAAILPTNVSGIHFHLSVEHGLVSLRHSVPDAMAEIPCCFVSADTERALNLASRHSLLRFAKQHRSGKPLEQRQVGIIEHRASRDAELIVAILAVEELLFGFQFDHGSLAAQAARTFGPAQAYQQFAAFLFGREQGMNIN